jgi:RNA polymerase primary sigma factor
MISTAAHGMHSNQPAIVIGTAVKRVRNKGGLSSRKRTSTNRLKVKARTQRARPGHTGNEQRQAEVAEIPDEVDRSSDPVLMLYFKEMSQVPLLSPAEEITLAKQFEKARLAEKKLSGLRGELNEIQRLKSYISKGYQARDRLIRANARLVINIAKKYRGYGLPFADLIQEGNLGLMRAVEKFDHRRGYRFSTYATWWIRQAVSRALTNQGRDIRLPAHYGGKLHKLNRASDQLTQTFGRSPTCEEVAAEMGQELSQVEWLIQVSQASVSLDSSPAETGNTPLSDFISDENIPSPVDTVIHYCLQAKLTEILGKLKPKEAIVLKLRFGLEDGRVYTLEEIGQTMGVTRERIRQIEEMALKKLRHSHDVAELRDYLT